MVLTGFLAMFGVPMLMGQTPGLPFFMVGFLMTLSFVALYAMANLGGRKMPSAVRLGIGLVAFPAALWGNLLSVVSPPAEGGVAAGWTQVILLIPILFGLILPVVAALKASLGKKGTAAIWAFYVYALPMLWVRFLLVPLVQVSSLAQLIAMQTGAFYLFLRGLVRIYVPTSAEGNPNAAPLVHRPVPDRIVGLVEGQSRHRARPFATRPDGSLDESVISILCRPEDVEPLSQKLRQALEGQPFTVTTGATVGGKVELVVGPEPAPEPQA